MRLRPPERGRGVIGALALSGRNVAYPGAYLKPYRRI